MRHQPMCRPLAFGTLACLLISLAAAPARADDLKIKAILGIGGRYRAGTWLPVTVSIVNTGTDAEHGQVQVYDDDALGEAVSVFARPADIAASGPAPQIFQVYARDLDPARADVVAALVSGAERGDGRVLAKASSLSTTGPSDFSGVAVADKDLLLVGFSADSSAFNFLNAQKWGVMHTAGGVESETAAVSQQPGRPQVMAGQQGNPASVQAVAAAPTELPDKPAGYSGVDAVLLRADAPLDSLSEAQTDALKAWVAAGGHLVVCGGADPTPFSDAFYTGLLPASVGPALGTTLSLTPKPLPGVRVVAREGGHPTIVEGLWGAGRITLLAADTPTIRAWSASRQVAFWKQALSGSPSSSLLSAIAGREEDNGSSQYVYFQGGSQLSDAVMRAPALDAPGADVVGLFLLAYVLILVPINYLVLKRLDKKEWAWATVPALVVIFAVTTYGVGYAAKGSSVFVNRAAVVETTAGERQAGLYTEIGLFSPHRTSYDMRVADPNALAAIPVPPEDYNNYYGRRGQSNTSSYGRTRFVEDSGEAKVQDAAINMWAMRAFDVQSATDLGGAFTSTLTLSPRTGQLGGTLANNTSHALTECRLYVGGQWLTLPDLPAGATAPVSAASVFLAANPNAMNQLWTSMPTLLGRNDKNDPDSDVRQRMRAALHDFVRDLGNDPTNGQYYGSNVTPPAVFRPRAGEAILTGWCSDDTIAGPPLQVDGHAVTQNNVTFVVVHIPLR